MSWIDDNHNIRNTIAHGTETVSIETVNNVSTKIDVLQSVAQSFLKDWRQQKLQLETTSERLE